MIKRLLHDVVKDDADLAEKLSSSNLLPLVRELNHRYGMVVYEENKTGQYVRDDRDDFLITDIQGLPLGRIFIDDGSYCYHAPYVAKERGSDEFDRHTFRSKKLSTLMSTLKRCEIVSSSDEVLKTGETRRQVSALVDRVISSFPYRDKGGMAGEDAHILLSMMKEGKDLNNLQQTTRDKYLELLDKYNEADILSSNRKQGTEEMFKDTYLIFGDVLGHYIVAEASYEYVNNQLTIKSNTPFKRVKDLTQYPQVLTALTMHKVHAGDGFKPYSGHGLGLVPLGDKYISDLEMVYGYRNRNTAFDLGCVCLSK